MKIGDMVTIINKSSAFEGKIGTITHIREYTLHPDAPSVTIILTDDPRPIVFHRGELQELAPGEVQQLFGK